MHVFDMLNNQAIVQEPLYNNQLSWHTHHQI